MQTALLFVLLPFAVLVVAGGLMAFGALRSAPKGFQDAEGFHFGEEPQPVRVPAATESFELAA